MIDYYETKSQPITKVMVWQAYKEVKSKAGSGGIDNMDWSYLAENQSTELYKLWNRLTSGSYFPQAVKQKSIQKKGGGKRQLGIPTLLDRIAQLKNNSDNVSPRINQITVEFLELLNSINTGLDVGPLGKNYLPKISPNNRVFSEDNKI